MRIFIKGVPHPFSMILLFFDDLLNIRIGETVLTKSCEYCGAPFIAANPEIGRPKRFCSIAHSRAARRQSGHIDTAQDLFCDATDPDAKR